MCALVTATSAAAGTSKEYSQCSLETEACHVGGVCVCVCVCVCRIIAICD